MKSLEDLFTKNRARNHYWSDYICFADAINGRRFAKKSIKSYFEKLVNKNDYFIDEKQEIIKYLLTLTRGK